VHLTLLPIYPVYSVTYVSGLYPRTARSDVTITYIFAIESSLRVVHERPLPGRILQRIFLANRSWTANQERAPKDANWPTTDSLG
jgi:hypothetical protein